MNDNKLMNRAADNIRILAASMVEKANSGHPGGAMGGADFVNVLFSEFLVYDPENPAWEGRDRFFLDPGHMSPMLYSQLALAGKFTLDELKELLQKNKVQLEGELDPDTVIGTLGMDSFDVMMLTFDLESAAGHELKLTLSDRVGDILRAVNDGN